MNSPINLNIKKVDSAKDLPLPSYGTSDSVGADLYANIAENITLAPGAHTLVPTGIIIEFESGYEAQIRPRSGLAYKHGITVLNSPATVDPDYRGEIKAILINHSTTPFVIERGMRIAQLVIAPFIQANWCEVADISETTERGTGGFGSTGGMTAANG